MGCVDVLLLCKQLMDYSRRVSVSLASLWPRRGLDELLSEDCGR